MIRGDRGVVLLEVLIAIVIVAVTGASLVAATAALLRAEEQAARLERALIPQEEVLAALTLLTRDELERRIGRRSIGRFEVEIDRPRAELFRIEVASRDEAALPPFVTIVYRGAPTR